DRRRARHPHLVEHPGDTGDGVPLQTSSEYPFHPWCGPRVRLQTVQAPAPGRVRTVVMWPGIGDAVSVRWPTTKMTALLAGLRLHGRGGAEPRPLPLLLGLCA